MPAKQSEFSSTEIKAGFLVLLSGVVFAIFFAAVLGYRPAPDGKLFYAYFNDMAGLRNGADVRFGGLKVGRVVSLDPAPEDHSMIRVTATVESDTPINEESVAYVTQTTLTSEMHLEISTGTNEAALLDSGATLPSGSGGLFGALEAAAEDASALMSDVGLLIGVRDENGERTMTDEEQETLSELFAGLGSLVDDLEALVGVTGPDGEPAMTEEELRSAAEIFAELDLAVKEGGALLGDLQDTLEENRPALNEAVEGIVEVEDAAVDLIGDLDSLLAENRENISAALEGLNTVMDDAQLLMDDLQSLAGNVDGFFENNEPVLEEILLDLRETLRNLETFSETLADQPQSIIRGRQPTGRK